MRADQFQEVLHAQFGLCETMLVDKAREYATADRLHNFKIAAELQDISPRRALAGMMAKHTVSIYDMCSSDVVYPMETWDEKITDHINYLVLLSALIIEEADSVVIGLESPIDAFLNSIGPE